MIEKGTDYAFATTDDPDRGWIFCPEYAGANPLDISPVDWSTKVFLFGPYQLPDSPTSRPPAEERVGVTSAFSPPAAGFPGHSATIPLRTTFKTSREGGVSDPAATSTGTAALPASDAAPEIGLGIDPITRRDVIWPLTLKGNPHLLVAGLPGMGKTTCLLNICKQMIAAGVSPIVFSYHEDIDQRLSDLVPSVRFVDFQGLGFNPLEVIDRQSRHGYLDVSGALRDIFAAIFPDLGDIQGESIRTAIKQSFIENGWNSPDINPGELREPDFRRFFEILRSTPKPDSGLRGLLARLVELADYEFFDLGESPASLWDGREPIVIRIHKTQNEVLQRAFAALVFYKLYKDMFKRGVKDRITHAIIFDEAHRAARLSLIPTMAKECRKYGISLVLASQEARDFHTSLFSAIANYLILHITRGRREGLGPERCRLRSRAGYDRQDQADGTVQGPVLLGAIQEVVHGCAMGIRVDSPTRTHRQKPRWLAVIIQT